MFEGFNPQKWRVCPLSKSLPMKIDSLTPEVPFLARSSKITPAVYEAGNSKIIWFINDIRHNQGGIQNFASWAPPLLGIYFARDSMTHVTRNHFLPGKIIFNQRRIFHATIN